MRRKQNNNNNNNNNPTAFSWNSGPILAGGVAEALSEIVEQMILPTHVEAMSDEAGVEIARKVRPSKQHLQPSRLFASSSEEGKVELYT